MTISFRTVLLTSCDAGKDEQYKKADVDHFGPIPQLVIPVIAIVSYEILAFLAKVLSIKRENKIL